MLTPHDRALHNGTVVRKPCRHPPIFLAPSPLTPLPRHCIPAPAPLSRPGRFFLVFTCLDFPGAALNDRALSEATKAFSNVHPVVARIIDQKGQMLLAENDLEGASSWFAEARQVSCVTYRSTFVLARLWAGRPLLLPGFLVSWRHKQQSHQVPQAAPYHHGGCVWGGDGKGGATPTPEESTPLPSGI